MASEEQYLDDLLKNIIGDEPPKERTMQDVMREIGVEYVPEPEVEIQIPETEVETQVPEINPDLISSDPFSVSDDIPTADTSEGSFDIPISDTSDESFDIPLADTSDELSQEDASNLTFPDQDVLADMLDILDNPASFANETQTAQTTEDEISNMLEGVPGIIDEPVVSEEPVPMEETVSTEEPVSLEDSDLSVESDPLQEDLESMLDGIEENFNAENISLDIPAENPSEELSSEEIVSQEDLNAMLEGLDSDASVEEPITDIPLEGLPIEETASQDDLSALLEGMGGDDPNAKMSPDDIAAMFAAAEGATAAAEETPAEEPIEEVTEEAPAEEPSQDDLAALLEGMGGDDPNAKMSPDDIAAMFAAAEGATAAAEETPAVETPAEEPIEEVTEEAPAEEPSQDDLAALLEGMGGDDPNAKMSPDDIAAMFAAAEGATAAAEETPAEETPAEGPAEETAEEDGVMMSSDDELLKMLGEATTAEDFVMPEDRLAMTEGADDVSIETDSESEADAPTGSGEIDENNLSQSDIEALMAGEPIGMPSGDSQEDLEALLAMAGEGGEEPAQESQDDLEAMLAAAGDVSEESASADVSLDGDISQDDLEAMLGGIDVEEPEASSEELSDVEKLEATEGSDEDLLSLLEGIDDTPEEERGLGGLPDELSGVIGEEDDQAKPKKKKFSLLSLLPFGKKKKKDEEEVQPNWDDIDGEPDADQPIEAAAEQIDDILAGIEAEGEESLDNAAVDGETAEVTPEAGEKKKGFFAKILSFLFDEEEEEETPPEEVSNEDILAQIDSENAEEDAAKGKKGKKGKKDKKKKGKKAEGEEGEGSSEEGEEGGDDSKKKKKKKEKAPKEPKEKEPRKVVLSKKAFIALVALCASLIAAIVILSSLLPDHADKVAARRAYFLGDYREVYDKLHDKNLGESDYLLYKKAETVLLLQRRIDSYRNRIKLNEPAQALDSLLEGVHLYDILSEGNKYNVNAELEPIYQEILEILKSEYGIDRDEAVMLYSMEDSDAYTEELIRIISGGNYKIEKPVNTAPEIEEEAAPDDIQGEIIHPDESGEEISPPDQDHDEMIPPPDADTAPEGEQVFEELHPLEDLLEAEEDL